MISGQIVYLFISSIMGQLVWVRHMMTNYKDFNPNFKEVDEEYRTTLINFAKYELVMFAMDKLMEMETTEQNKVALYLFNHIKI